MAWSRQLRHATYSPMITKLMHWPHWRINATLGFPNHRMRTIQTSPQPLITYCKIYQASVHVKRWFSWTIRSYVYWYCMCDGPREIWMLADGVKKLNCRLFLGNAIHCWKKHCIFCLFVCCAAIQINQLMDLRIYRNLCVGWNWHYCGIE